MERIDEDLDTIKFDNSMTNITSEYVLVIYCYFKHFTALNWVLI